MSTIAPPHIVLGPKLAGISLTPEEFDAIEEADRNYRYEFIDGRLIVSPPPLEAEHIPNDELGHLLREYRDTHLQGSALDATLPEQTVITKDNRRRADRVVWTGLGRRPDPHPDLPSIVIEWVPESRRDWYRDYVEKSREYRGMGIAEYWIIDRFQRTLTVYQGTPEAPREVVVPESECYRTQLLPGFEVPLAELLAVTDRWR